MYSPRFCLKGFESFTTEEKIIAIEGLLSSLIVTNCIILRKNPSIPPLYSSGVVYVREPPGRDDWQDIAETIARGNGDCEDLGSWRCAELIVRSNVEARPSVKAIVLPDYTLFHVRVKLPSGELLDPSKKLGMQ